MKLNDCKIKFKYLYFQPNKSKSRYNYEDIMYLYYSIKVKLSKGVYLYFDSADLGHQLSEFVLELKELIKNESYLKPFGSIKLGIISTDYMLNKYTQDSSFSAEKKVYEDRAEYSLIFKKSNSLSVRIDWINEEDIVKFVQFLDKEFENMFELQGKIDSVLLDLGENYEIDLYDIIIEDITKGLSREEIIFHYYQLLQHKYKVDSLVGSFAIEKIRLNSKDRVELYKGYNGELDVEELIEKVKRK